MDPGEGGERSAWTLPDGPPYPGAIPGPRQPFESQPTWPQAAPPPPAPPPSAPPAQWPPSGYPPAPQSWPPPQWPPPQWAPAPRRRPLALRLILLFTVLAVLCGAPAVWGFMRVAPSLAPGSAGPGPGPAGTDPSGATTSQGPRSPRPGDAPGVRGAWMRAEIETALGAQATALLGGSEPGFVAVADAGNAPVRTELTRRYRSLKAMRVTRWEASLAGLPKESGTEWTAKLNLRHCFVVPTCEPDNLEVQSRWVERDGRAFLVGLDASTSAENGPRPWEVAELRVAVGTRAVVATTAKYASRLTTLIGEADKAAAVADRFVVGAPAPDRYHVFFAGGAEWKQWFSGNRPDWAAGYAVPTSQKRIDVVLNAAETPATFVDDIMRHELSHVASLRGAQHQGKESWWLIEGLAEYAEMNGRPAKQYDAVAAGAVRSYVRAGWTGTVAVTEPDSGAALREAGARYGIAFLAYRRLVDRYGEAKVLRFFTAVVHEGTSTSAASADQLGAPWTAVEADCVSFIRSTAG